MVYLPGQAPSGLDTDGVRKFTEEELRNISRSIAAGEQSSASSMTALAARVTTLEGRVTTLETATNNYIVNSTMQISQENGSSVRTVSGDYPVDQFFSSFVTDGALSYAQVASPTPGGSMNRIRFTVTAPDTSIAATQYAQIQTALEGFRVSDLKFGSAAAKQVVIRFGVKAPAGTYSVILANNAQNRSYVSDYVIAAGEANIDVVKSVVVPGDTAGTWFTDTTAGFRILWALAVGSTYAGAPGSWITPPTVGSINQFNFMGTNGNVFELFDVGLYKGPTAPPFWIPDYASELLACRRYFYNGVPPLRGLASGATLVSRMACRHPVQMRIAPALTMTSALSIYNGVTAQAAVSLGSNFSTTEVIETEINMTGSFAAGQPCVVYQSGVGNLNVNARP